MKLILLTLSLFSFSALSDDKQMKCEKVSSGFSNPTISRCENSEVICYIHGHDSNPHSFCKFKEAK